MIKISAYKKQNHIIDWQVSELIGKCHSEMTDMCHSEMIDMCHSEMVDMCQLQMIDKRYNIDKCHSEMIDKSYNIIAPFRDDWHVSIKKGW